MFRTARISKRNGDFRTIVIQDEKTRLALQRHLAALNSKAKSICGDVAHGFMPGRNPVTNALSHVGHRYTICFDLKDFFDSVTPSKVSGLLSKEEVAAVFVDPDDGKGLRAAQGLSTSPAVANIAGSRLDTAILRAIDKAKLQVVYTRYADDLSFSFDAPDARTWLLKNIPVIASRCGFKINEKKTRFMPASAGRRVITGVSVGDSDIRPTRDARRRLRAARHHVRMKKAAGKDAVRDAMRENGLQEWCKLKTPSMKMAKIEHAESLAQRLFDAFAITSASAKKFGREYVAAQKNAPFAVDFHEGDFLITRNLAYMLGMSTLTTGWKSCMSHPSGEHRKGTLFWPRLAGTAIATILSKREILIAGGAYRAMRARCLLHSLRDGKTVYDRMYGDQDSIRLLAEWLESKGYMSVAAYRDSRMKNGCKKSAVAVVGYVPAGGRKPYLDSLHLVGVKLVGRKGKYLKVTT